MKLLEATVQLMPQHTQEIIITLVQVFVDMFEGIETYFLEMRVNNDRAVLQILNLISETKAQNKIHS